MLPPHALAEVRRHLVEPNASHRVHAVLSALGWDQHDAMIEGVPTDHSMGRLVLGSYPTGASATYAKPRERRTGPRWRSYLRGFRWCLEVRKAHLNWCDFGTGREWSASSEQLRTQNLLGFTPDYFRAHGRLEPTSADLRPLDKALPVMDATDLVADELFAWWSRHLVRQKTDAHIASLKKSFIKTVATIFLIQAAEATGALSWLKLGTLAEAAKKEHHLARLLATCSTMLNSRVLHETRNNVLPARDFASLITQLNDLPFDIRDLELDPVGPLYERLIGSAEKIAQPTQLSILQENDLLLDSSFRRQAGIYYTPRVYADLLARHLVAPEATVAQSGDDLPRIVDPAVGSGELLCAALRQILSFQAWRSPDTVRSFLANKLYCVDTSELAIMLAALNVLRTSIRAVPELLEKPLPSLDKNFVVGDALAASTWINFEGADIALLNPPFHGSRRWSLPAAPVPALNHFRSRPNQSIAFLVASVSMLRKGGGIGAIVPSQWFSQPSGQEAREWLSEKVAIETVIENYSTPFRDAYSYAGILIGHVRGSREWTPRTRIVTIPGKLKFDQVDVGAVAAGSDSSKSGANSTWVTLQPKDGTWTKIAVHEKRRSHADSATVGDFLSSKSQFHQGIVPAPKLPGRDLWLFDPVSDREAIHLLTKTKVSSLTPSLKPVAIPNLLQKQPRLLEPDVPAGTTIFYPHAVSSITSIDVEELRQVDQASYQIGLLIQSSIIKYVPPFTDVHTNAENGFIGLLHPRTFTYTPEPLIVASKSLSPAGGYRTQDSWNIWLAKNGDKIPVSGIWARCESISLAILLVGWLSLPSTASMLIERSAKRHLGTTEPTMKLLSSCRAPDLGAALDSAIAEDIIQQFWDYHDAPSDTNWTAFLRVAQRLDREF